MKNKFSEIKFTIKFPNDILANEKKICGILIERIFDKNNTLFILGIGININMVKNFYIKKAWTSIKLITNKETNRYKLFFYIIRKILNAIENI